MITLDKKILEQNLEKRIAEDMEKGVLGNGAIEVRQNGEVMFSRIFSCSKPGYETDKNTMYRLASMTKPITAAAVLILVDRGMLSLDDKVSRYIPAFANKDLGRLNDKGEIEIIGKAKNELTIRDLLRHSNGLWTDDLGNKYFSKFKWSEMDTLEKMVDNVLSPMPLAFDPFTATGYSATASFDVAARIVELLSGETYDKFLKKEIFDPLGMTDMTFQPTEEQWSRFSAVNKEVGGKQTIYPFPPRSIYIDWPTTLFLAGAGLASTLSDYVKFAELLVHDGKCGDRQIISEKMITEMHTVQTNDEINPGDTRWGLGVTITVSDEAPRPIGSYGWSGAYGTHFWVDPTNKISAVYLRNSIAGDSGDSRRYIEPNFQTDVYTAAK